MLEVIRAIEATQEILDHTNKIKDQTGLTIPVYASHPIVHHDPISNEFASRGLIVEPNWERVEPGSIYLLSAHGTQPSVVEKLRESGVEVVNLECQLVYGDRKRAEGTLRKGRDLVYFGRPGHPEVIAVTKDLDQDRVHVIDSAFGPDQFNLPGSPFDILSQTTISRDRVKTNVLKWGEINGIEVPVFEKGPCEATDLRQNALTEMFSTGRPLDLIITVMSGASHNGGELVKMGEEYYERSGREITRSIGVDSFDKLETSLFTEDIQTVGITSAASVLDRFTVPFLQWFKKGGAAIRMDDRGPAEDYGAFPPPKDLARIHQILEHTYGIEA